MMSAGPGRRCLACVRHRGRSRRGVLATGLLIMLVAASTAWGAIDLAGWRYRKAIRVQSSGLAYAEAAVDGEVYDRAAGGLQDLRIIANTGEETPYVLREWPGSEVDVAVPATVINRAVMPRQRTIVELDTAGTRKAHNRLRLQIDAPTFSRSVTIEGSDNRRTWLRLGSGMIHRFTEGTSVDVTTVAYPPSVYRYIRVTILDEGKSPLPVQGAAVIFHRIVPPREDRWFAGPVRGFTDPSTKTTTVVIDAGHRNLPLSRIALNVSSPRSFARDVEISVSDDGQAWTGADRAVLTRAPAAALAASVGIAFSEARGRFVRLQIANGDNVPLEITRAAIFGIRRTLLFPMAPDRSYHLYFGNSGAQAPQYDLPRVLDLETAPPKAAPSTLGPLEPNPAYLAPVVRRPWTEEHPVVLWSALGAAVLVLLALIVRTVRGTGAVP